MSEEKTEGTEQSEEKPAVQIVNVDGGDSAKKLDTTLTFTMDWTNPETGKRLTGTFTAVRPNIGMVQQIAVVKARYNGGERITKDIDFINEMVAYLQVVLTDAPSWWQPESFYTADPLRKVWDHVRSWEDSFRKGRVGQ